MIKIPDLKKALEDIDYRLIDRGENYVIEDHKGVKFAWIWYGKQIEIEITSVVKVYYLLENAEMKILPGGTISIGEHKDSGYIQFYNHDKDI